jgi:hypothetical protein
MLFLARTVCDRWNPGVEDSNASREWVEYFRVVSVLVLSSVRRADPRVRRRFLLSESSVI